MASQIHSFLSPILSVNLTVPLARQLRSPIPAFEPRGAGFCSDKVQNGLNTLYIYICMVLPVVLCGIVTIIYYYYSITITITFTITITITITITMTIMIIIIIIFIIVVGVVVTVVVVAVVVVVHYSFFIMCYRYALSLLSSKSMVPESQTVQKMMELCPNLGRWETAKLCQLWINKPPFGLPSGKLT